MAYSVIIPAAGQGSRMGISTPKVLLSCNDGRREHQSEQSILARTVAVFDRDPNCNSIVVCAPAAWREQCEQEISFAGRTAVVNGGSTRQESVSRGVSALVEKFGVREDSVVLVHDAARCCVTPDVIERVVQGVVEHGAVTAAVPIFDALSRADDGILTTYVDRDALWSIQTPQGFMVRDLVTAHTKAESDGTQALDDAALVGRLRSVHVVMGDRLNIKVTHPDDLRVARMILSGDC
jgi:2-C-methyl-D-erythritol 4-phosphate cytidylyltransferase